MFCLGLKKKLPTLGIYIIQWLNLGLKPQERVTNKRLDLAYMHAFLMRIF